MGRDDRRRREWTLGSDRERGQGRSARTLRGFGSLSWAPPGVCLLAFEVLRGLSGEPTERIRPLVDRNELGVRRCRPPAGARGRRTQTPRADAALPAAAAGAELVAQATPSRCPRLSPEGPASSFPFWGRETPGVQFGVRPPTSVCSGYIAQKCLPVP